MPKVYIVNTNKSNHPESENEMITQEKVAAYYSPWKYLINDIAAGDIVYLYSNGQGIIARGVATGILEVGQQVDGVYKEHYMHLNRFELLNTPLPSKKISDIAKSLTDEDYNIRWNQTMIHMPYFIGLEIWQLMTNECF